MKTINEYSWEDKLTVGYNHIDLQHKKLLLIISEFKQLLCKLQKEYSLHIGKVLKSLTDYTIYHFAEEEKILSKFKYPDLEEHKKIHAKFVEKMQANFKLLASGDISSGIEFYEFLGKWLIIHIAQTDQEWSRYIKKNYPNEKF